MKLDEHSLNLVKAVICSEAIEWELKRRKALTEGHKELANECEFERDRWRPALAGLEKDTSEMSDETLKMVTYALSKQLNRTN